MAHFQGLEDFYEEKHRAPKIASGEVSPKKYFILSTIYVYPMFLLTLPYYLCLLMQLLKTLWVRGHTSHIPFDVRYIPYLRRAKLFVFVTMAQRPMPLYNAAALTALVDIWRLETHTFHLPCGELTVTLEDVAVTTGNNPTGVPYVRALFHVPGGKVHQKLIQFRV